MSLICKITTTTTISFGEDSGIGWRVARSYILAGATLYTPFSFFDMLYTTFVGCCAWNWILVLQRLRLVVSVSDIPSLRIAFMPYAVSNGQAGYLDSNVYMYWM